MTLNFLVAPDFPPQHFPGWHMLNIMLQRRSGIGLHLLLPSGAGEQARMVAEDRADLVYANPFDATGLVRDKGFLPVVKPVNRPDEMVIAVAEASPCRTVEDLRPGNTIVLTDNRDVKLIGLRLIEPADLVEADLAWHEVDSYQAAARQLIQGKADAAFFLASAFHSMSRLTRSQMHVVMESRLRDISHVVLAHPRMAEHLSLVGDALLALGDDDAGREVLEAVGLGEGFEAIGNEDTEFMIDLMDTLLE